MKKITLLIMALLTGFLGINQDVKGQTKVFDQEITWTHDPYEHGGYGFYWWHRTDGQSIINYGDMPSDNWSDYYGGEFTLSVEVLSQPTTNPFWIQFGIWGDYWKGGDHTETVASRLYVNGGAGSSGSWSLGSPSGWWNKQSDDHLDFSRADDFYRIGVVLWNTDPLCIPMGTEWNSSGCPEFGPDFFPLTIRIRVYASTGTYVPPVENPDYSIDFWGERTSEAISTDDQYSYDNSTWYDGTGTNLSLTPGTDVYFRKKSDWSKTQTLDVPYRPSAPSFGIEYAYQRTSETVSSSYKYSSNSDMSSSATGDGSYVYLTPGSNMYFTQNANSGAFRSEIQELVVPDNPAAPSFGIDYTVETTSTAVSSAYQYSVNSDMSSAVTGDGSYVDLTPGSHLFFRKYGSDTEFPSEIQDLDVPARPAAPSFVIDYINSRTSTTVGSGYEYSSSADMSGAVSGTGDYVDIQANSTIYFRAKATSSAFVSEIQALTSGDVPAAPDFQIDYLNEVISTPIGSTYVYGSSADLSDAVQGSDNILQVVPGEILYFQKMATASDPASEIQTLEAPARPAGPSPGIDYVNETTDIVISSDMQYSSSPSFEPVNDGPGAVVALMPGTDFYFRTSASASAFASEGFQLVVPNRPVISSAESGTTTAYPLLTTFTFSQDIASLDASSILVVNAELNNISTTGTGSGQTVFQGLVYATANDVISMQAPANAVSEGNFVSNSFEIEFTGDLPGTGIDQYSSGQFTVFPNPGNGVFHLSFDNFSALSEYRLELCSLTGEVVHTETFTGTQDQTVDLSGFPSGLYLLRVFENESYSSVVKLIIK